MNRCRLFIDEVGNDDLKPSSHDENQRYLSLTSLLTRIDLYESRFIPRLADFKTSIFGNGSDAIVLHRREILRREKDFIILNDDALRNRFDAEMLILLRQLPYLISTVVIDKFEYVKTRGEWLFHPYHYCLKTLVERYVLWMRRNEHVGDVVIEQRYPKADKQVKVAFQNIYEQGTEHIPAKIVQKYLTSKEIKFVSKKENCPAMQIVDLIAYPSFKALKYEQKGDQLPNDYGKKIVDILEGWKYARHPTTFNKEGWGKKWLP